MLEARSAEARPRWRGEASLEARSAEAQRRARRALRDATSLLRLRSATPLFYASAAPPLDCASRFTLRFFRFGFAYAHKVWKALILQVDTVWGKVELTRRYKISYTISICIFIVKKLEWVVGLLMDESTWVILWFSLIKFLNLVLFIISLTRLAWLIFFFSMTHCMIQYNSSNHTVWVIQWISINHLYDSVKDILKLFWRWRKVGYYIYITTRGHDRWRSWPMEFWNHCLLCKHSLDT